MGAASLGARLRRSADQAMSCGLAFDKPGGPIVAVCGLVGGSGASTVAFYLARQAARESRAPVLLTAADTRRADLAVLAGRATPMSLPDLARQVAEQDPPNGALVELEPRLRLLASGPRPTPDCTPTHLRALLREARASHGLVVIDCATAWADAGPVLEEASHIAWTLAATPSAVARARLLFASDVVPKPGQWRESLIATTPLGRPRASVRTLRELAACRCERLMFMPYCDGLANGDLEPSRERLGRALAGLATTLHRTR